MTPCAGLSLADGAGRGMRMGVRWDIAPNIALKIEATWTEGLHAGPEQALGLHAVRW